MPIKLNVHKKRKQLRYLNHLALPEPIGGEEDSSGVITIPPKKLNQELIVKHYVEEIVDNLSQFDVYVNVIEEWNFCCSLKSKSNWNHFNFSSYNVLQ